MKYILSAIVIIVIGVIMAASKPINPNSYSQGYAYGKKTGNSYLAPLPPQSKFNAGAAQAVKDSTK